MPLLLLWLGIDESPKIVLIAIGAFFPVCMAAVDAFTRMKLQDLLLMVTHDIDEAVHLSDRVARERRGGHHARPAAPPRRPPRAGLLGRGAARAAGRARVLRAPRAGLRPVGVSRKLGGGPASP